jgi:hypothetical protein
LRVVWDFTPHTLILKRNVSEGGGSASDLRADCYNKLAAAQLPAFFDPGQPSQ